MIGTGQGKAGGAHALAEVGTVLLEAGTQVVTLGQHVDHLDGGRDDGGCQELEKR